MTRDIRDRLELFGASTTVDRIALNRDQIDRYTPPPNPAKLTDARAAGYIREHGRSSWELDALSPEVLDALIQGEIEALRDEDEWGDATQRQETAREIITTAAARWDEIVPLIEALDD